MEFDFELKNCYGDIFNLRLDMTNVKYIFRQVLSGDEIYTVVYNDNKVECYDSDIHFRHIDYHEEFEMIYPNKINLLESYTNPNTVKNFITKENLK